MVCLRKPNMERKYELSDAESTDESVEGTDEYEDVDGADDNDDGDDDDDDDDDKFCDTAVSKVYDDKHKKFKSTFNRLSEIHPEKIC